METIILIIGTVWGILNIILFFKLWGACDDIRRITNKYAPDLEKSNLPRSTVETKKELDDWLKEE